MPGPRALAFLGYAALLMMVMLSRPSSGMRIVMLTILLAVTALAGMSLAIKHLAMGIAGMN